MKKKFIFLIFGGVILLIILYLTRCSNNNYSGNITSFKYQFGSYHSGYYDYDINVDDGKVKFIASGQNGVDLDINKVISKSYLIKLEEVIIDNNISEWNGFNKNDDEILDGYSFYLEIKYLDGNTIEARGYMKYPKNYNKVHKEIIKILNSIK